jgi:hypothetical protein
MSKKLAKILLFICVAGAIGIFVYQFADYLITQIRRSQPVAIIHHDSTSTYTHAK